MRTCPRAENQLCDGCCIPSSQAPGGKLRACSACQSAAFCSTACLAQAWPGHRAECQRIKAVIEEKRRLHNFPLPIYAGFFLRLQCCSVVPHATDCFSLSPLAL